MSKVRGSVLASAMMIAGLSLVLAVTQAQAQQTTPPATRIGDATRSLLELQRDGRAAAPAQPMLGAEAGVAYARYLKSFDHPIPEQLNSSVGEVGSGSGITGGGVQN